MVKRGVRFREDDEIVATPPLFYITDNDLLYIES